MATKIQLRRGLAALWTSENPTLSQGELGIETDTNKIKIGDGLTAWNSLDYFEGSTGFEDPMTTRGDIIYKDSSNTTTRLGVGTNGQVLTTDGTDLTWGNQASGFEDPMTTRGDIIYKNASNVTTRLAAGTVGQVLTSDGTDISWDDAAAGYTDEEAQDAVGTILTDSSTIDFTYTDATPEITADVIDGSITLAKMDDMATSSLIYRKTAGTGVPEVNTLATLKTDLGLTGTNSGDQSSSDFTHNDLTGLDDGDYKHLTATNYTDLTDSGDSTLHYHATDRARANHTGTQAASTISDFDTEVANNSTVTSNTGFRTTPSTVITAGTNISWTGNTLNVSSPTNLVVDSTPDTDETVEGITTTMTVGESVTFGQLLYMKSDGKLWKAKADDSATMPVIAMAAVSISADASGSVLLQGFARDDTWAWTVGGQVYASNVTAGDTIQTLPSDSGDQVQVIGIATHADRIYFKPDLTLIEVA